MAQTTEKKKPDWANSPPYQVQDYVSRKIYGLEAGPEFRRKKIRSDLRRANGNSFKDSPMAWGEILSGFPEVLFSKGGEPSYAENAAFTAMCCYALEKNRRDYETPVKRVSLGRAMRALVDPSDPDSEARVIRRFRHIVNAKSLPEFARHMRTLVQMTNAKNIYIDYSRLAKDLYVYQFDPQKIRFHWTEDYFKKFKKTEEN